MDSATRSSGALQRDPLSECLYSAAYTFAQSPITAISQVVDKAVGTQLTTQTEFMEAPAPVPFNPKDPCWYAQQFGSALAMSAHIYGLNKLLPGCRAQALVANRADSAVATEAIKRSSLIGGLYTGAFTPTHGDDNESFFGARLRSATVGALTFGTLTACSFGLRAISGEQSFLRNRVVAGAVSGIPAGIVSADATALLSHDRLASNQERFESAFGFATIGGALAGLHAGEAAIRARLQSQSRNTAQPMSGRSDEMSTEPKTGAQSEPKPVEIVDIAEQEQQLTKLYQKLSGEMHGFANPAETLTQIADVLMKTGRVAQAVDIYELIAKREHLYLRPDSLPKIGPPDPMVDTITAQSNPYLDAFKQVDLDRVGALVWSARDALVHKYAWGIPSEQGLALIAEQGPVVEVGAGTGYWAALLKARGVDVVAYDKAPPNETANDFHVSAKRTWTEVLSGDETAAANHGDRALLLAWPPLEDPMAFNALTNYKGKRLIFVGNVDSCGDMDFSDLIGRDWRPVNSVDLPEWDYCPDAVRVYERKDGRP